MEEENTLEIIAKRGMLEELEDSANGDVKHSFVFRFLCRFPDRIKAIDVMYAMLGRMPMWNDLTETFFKKLYDCFSLDYRAKTIQHFFYSIERTMKDAYKDGIISNAPTKHLSSILPPIKGLIRSENELFFTNREVELIHECQLRTECQKYTRKIFMLMCLCGCSFEDAIEMTPDNISNGYIYYIKDNGVEVSVPMHRWIEGYLHQNFEKTYSRACVAKVLKRVIFLANIKDDYYFKDGHHKPKYKIVQFNTAQKTFATLLYNSDISVETIQSYMGVLQKQSMCYYIAGYEGPRKTLWRLRSMKAIPI